MIPKHRAPSAVRRLRRTSVAVGAVLAACALAARPARAFERQWHVGAGFGLVGLDRTYSQGAASALHGAYGVSDLFDARFELRGSLHDTRAPGTDRVELFQGTLGLAYKVDIIEWIPYFGVRGGYYLFGSRPLAAWCTEDAEGQGPRCARGGGVLGAMLGIDYAFARSAAIGAELGYDILLPERRATSALVRAEYRWGW